MDGDPVVFEWKILPGHTTLQLLQEAQKMMENELKIQPQNFEGRVVFMSMNNDIDRTKRDNEETCKNKSSYVAAYARSFPKKHRSFLGPGCKENWYGTAIYKPDGVLDRPAEEMMATFRERGYLIFCGTTPLTRGTLKSKGEGKTSIHDHAEAGTADLLLRTFFSVDQLSIYGAVADWCDELTQRAEARPSLSSGRPETQSRTRLVTGLLKFRLRLCRVLPRIHLGNLKPRETWCGNTMKSSKIFQKIYS